jgi:hypothetical protein
VKLSGLFLAALVASFVNRGLAAPPQALTEADANHKVALEVGQELVLDWIQLVSD